MPNKTTVAAIKATLATIKESPDLYVDACVVDTQSRDMIFMSVWGRDTAIQELLARMTLEASASESLKGGITLTCEERQQKVYFRNTDDLEKRLSRDFLGTLFGSLINLWLFHSQCTNPDRANHSAYVLLNQADLDLSGTLPVEMHRRLCVQLMDLAPFPILPEWSKAALDQTQKHKMLIKQETLLGDLTCFRLHLDAPRLEHLMSEMIRSDQLTLSVA